MIELVYSNKTERLLDDLSESLSRWRDGGAHPLEPVELVTPNRNMETWIRLGLAQASGIAANLRFRRLERFIGETVSETCPGDFKLVDLDTVEAAVLAVLLNRKILCQTELQPVRRYLESTGSHAGNGTSHPSAPPGVNPAMAKTAFDRHIAADGADIRRVQLASRIAYLFQEYTYSRPEMISSWRGTGAGYGSADSPFADPASADPALTSTVTWQRALWKAVFGENGILESNPPEEGGSWATLDQLALNDALFRKIKSKGLPPVHIFGVSYVARIFQHLFARMGEACTLRIYALNPCAEFWEDVETDREFFHRLDREINRRSNRLWTFSGETGHEDPFGLFDADTPALRYWGRPGREHVRLLGELTDCDFKSAFSDPAESDRGLLHKLQQDIMNREPERKREPQPGGPEEGAVPAGLPDESINLVAAPSIRREVEWVADEIWRLVRDDRPGEGQMPLRFSDIAVIVNSAGREEYLPQIETVFAASHNLPGSVSDLPAAAGSRVIEAMNLLLELPFGRFSRVEMLALISHPAVIGRLEDVTPGDLADQAEALGIVFGADHSDHGGTYIDEDVYNWDQGIRRLALGAFMTGRKSGEERTFEADGGRWLVEEVSGSAVNTAARFGLLSRSLLADARFVRDHRMTLTDWAGFYTAQIDAYLHIEDDADARDRLRLIRSLAKLENMDRGFEVSGRVAAEIAGRAIETLSGGSGQYLAEGVVVSSFLPMRAIPFRVIFVLGLGEGLFPASGLRDALDLRAARRRAGDVDPSERDRYMFLETLLCTRERLYLSYVRRDEQTGDPLQPSAIVQELLHMLEHGYLGEEKVKELFIEPPLRRFDEPAVFEDSFTDEARVEARVREVARDWRNRAYRVPAGGTLSTAPNPIERGNELAAIRRVASQEAWKSLSEMLVLPGEPPGAAPVTATARTGSLEDEGAVEAPINISLSTLRRFLECPMQGWASAMLGLTEMEDDLADREEEDFEVGRLIETGLLRAVLLDSSAAGTDPAELYDQRTAQLRLAGKVPIGILGRVNRARHLRIISGWSSILEEFQSAGESETVHKAISTPLLRVRFGHSGQQGPAETILDPLSLEVALEGIGKPKRVVPVRINGLTEGLVNDRLVSVTFQPKKPPAQKNGNTLASAFRYLLRGIVDHAVLSAAGEAGTRERQVLVCYAGAAGETGRLRLKLLPLEQERARSWLAAVATDLLRDSHAYLMPCEAVFLAYYEQMKTITRGKKGSEKSGAIISGLPGADVQSLLDGEFLRSKVVQMAEKERAVFSSLWGPVPLPRNYQPPTADQAARNVWRRFGPLFEDITGLEGF